MLPLSNIYLFTATKHLTKAAYRREGIRGLQSVGAARCGQQGATGGPRCHCPCPCSQEAESSCCCCCPAPFCFVWDPTLGPSLQLTSAGHSVAVKHPIYLLIQQHLGEHTLLCIPGPNIWENVRYRASQDLICFTASWCFIDYTGIYYLSMNFFVCI